MTTDAPLAPSAPPCSPHAGRYRVGADLVPAAERGDLTIADGVIEKIAATLVAQVDQIGGTARRVLGVPLGSGDPDGLPQVRATVTGSVVALEVACTVTYPAPIGRVTDQARRHLIGRIAELTDLTVRQVDITVTALRSTTKTTPRGLQ
ncbi:MAG: Asp23/Gls24 family envelope stress response protein [Candidatus Dormibacteraeota bacterium]|uniref:Asp23/Gls24 family envelope stress response protein n=1 Tax=Candidatus Amunia macphersoniae TaxID=3127014 RepID=A0A934KAG2_9BACT|nr:Asp23/Gls24 family envelope stress response protein [Candidatus Dormibacteraeota bacterium]